MRGGYPNSAAGLNSVQCALMRLRLAAVVIFVTVTAAHAAEPEDTARRAAKAAEKTAKRAADAVERTATKAGKAMERGAKRADEWVRDTAKKTDKAIKRLAE
jgi:hypothetical protein